MEMDFPEHPDNKLMVELDAAMLAREAAESKQPDLDPLDAAIRAQLGTVYYRASASQSTAVRKLQGAVTGALDYAALVQRDAAGTPFELSIRAIFAPLYGVIAAQLDIDPPKEN